MAKTNPVEFPTYITRSKVQRTFIGGLDTVSGDTQIADDSYLWLINGRNRFGYVDPIKKHRLLNAPKGLKQGLIAVGNVLILFVGGLAYYQVDGDTTWTTVANFKMSSDAPKLWSCAVPYSTFDFKRKASTDIITDPFGVDKVNEKINGTPAGIVVQDGINQPRFISYDGINFIGRTLQSYGQWSSLVDPITGLVSHEYVPIGKQMILFNGNTLFIVSPDGKSIYRSITGRPLDFMLNVDTDGNKQPLESAGGAATTSFSFDFDMITAIQVINIPDSFIYATQHNVRVIAADYTNLIFGEPTYKVSAIIQAGVVKEDCIQEILGDYAFVDFESVVAFDAVQQLKFNGRNSIFSLPLSKFLKNIKQQSPCSVVFSNYAIWNLDTNMGNVMAVYDTLLTKWISIDITDVTKIKQFAITEPVDRSRLYCITAFDEVYEMFPMDETKTYLCQLHTKSHVSGETDTEHKSQAVRLLFNSGTFDGKVTVIEYVDEKCISDSNGDPVNRVSKRLDGVVSGILYPIRPPVIPDTLIRADNPSFNFSKGLAGKKLSYIIQWDNDAKLIEYHLVVTMKKSTSSLKETQQVTQGTYGING